MAAKQNFEVHCSYKELVDVDLLVPHPFNPNTHSERQVELLAKILKHSGWRNPITVSNRSGYIVAGHGRLLAALKNGWTKVPVDRQDFKTEADEYAHLVADNKIQELSSLDAQKIDDIFSKLPEGFDTQLFGADDFILSADEIDPEDAFGALSEGDKDGLEQITFTLSKDQKLIVNSAIEKAKKEMGEVPEDENPNKNGNALHYIVLKFNECQAASCKNY